MKARIKSLAFVLPLVTFALAASAGADQELYSYEGEESFRLGESVSAADVDGDGIDDMIIGTPKHHSIGDAVVEVYSGVDGSLIHRINGASVNDYAFSVAGIGDLDLDGRSEFIVGAWGDSATGPSAGRAFVYSGLDASLMQTLDAAGPGLFFGYAVAGIGDANQDGRPDFAVGSGSGLGGVTLFSGLDFSVLWEVQSTGSLLLGRTIGAAGDVNGDGLADIIVGSQFSDTMGDNSGSALVYSGLDGSVLHTFHGSQAGDFMGSSVDSAGDVNNDGYADLIVGARGSDEGATRAGLVRVFSGLDGAILHSFYGFGTEDGLGDAVAGVGDMNGDGIDDLAMSSSDSDFFDSRAGYVKVHSGADGRIIHLWGGLAVRARFGGVLSAAGDMDGDGIPKLIVGSPDDGGIRPESGSVHVFSGAIAEPQPYCFADGSVVDCPCGNLDPEAGCANSTGKGAVLIASGSASIVADDLTLTVLGCPTFRTGLMFMGVSTITVPFADGLLCTGGPLQRLPLMGTGPLGGFSIGPDLAAYIDISGLASSYFQTWFRDPGGPCGSGSNLSNAIAVTWLP